MATYIILSTFAEDGLDEPFDLVDRAEQVSRRIENDCPDVEWIDSYATMGRYDVVDIVRTDEPVQVEQAAMIIRSTGHAVTETLTAVPWDDLLGRLR